MTTDLRLCVAAVLEHVEELPETVQEEVAELLEQFTEPCDIPVDSLAGSMPDLPDDAEETLLRWRHEVPPTPSMDEQLAWLDEE